MDQVVSLLDAIAGLLWPLMAGAVLWFLRDPIKRVIESASSRHFTLKVGGQELTMDELSQQQGTLIADLQSQVAALRDAMAQAGIAVVAPSSETAPRSVGGAVLWVDDEPKNNSYFVQQLSNVGVDVDLALSTAEALQRMGRRQYSVVLSDMGRSEPAGFDPVAGLNLLEQMRKAHQGLPYVIYTSAQGERDYRGRASALGAYAITSSPTVLTGLLQKLVGRWPA